MQQRENSAPKAEPVQILGIPKGESPICVRFLGPCRGILTHWKDKKAFACLGQDSCPKSLHATLTLWKGYAPALHYRHDRRLWIPVVLELTEVAEEETRGRHRPGDTWLVSRRRDEHNTVKAYVSYVELYSGPLPAAFDVAPVLFRRYHTTGIPMDIPNPIVPRVQIEPISAPPPRGVPLPAEKTEQAPVGPPPVNPALERQFAAAAGLEDPTPEKPVTAEQLEQLRAVKAGLGQRVPAAAGISKEQREANEKFAAAHRNGKGH